MEYIDNITTGTAALVGENPYAIEVEDVVDTVQEILEVK